jgi:hypothetical protein
MIPAMPKPRYNFRQNNVLALCPECKAITNFEPKSLKGADLGRVEINEPHHYEGRNYDDCREG